MRKMFPIAVLVVTILAFTVALLPQKTAQVEATPEPSASSAPEDEGASQDLFGIVMVPDGMKLFSDSQLGVRIAYPENFIFEKNGNYSVMFSPPENPVGNPVPTFIYLSVIPTEQHDAEDSIYNYRLEDIDRLLGLALQENTTLTENRQLDQWYKYTRLADREIGGVTAKQYVNQKPWEFPNGTTETRYLLEKDGTRYLLGAYYQSNNPRLTKQMFSDMVDSFSILSGQEILE